MTPRFTRTLLFLSTLSLLVLPAGKAQAQSTGELTAALSAGSAVSCVSGTTHTPLTPARIPVTIAHERCTGGAFGDIGIVTIEATRDAGLGMLTARCNATPLAGSTVPFNTRENTAAGRGRVGPAEFGVGTGTVMHLDGSTGDGPCTIRITGAFHRVGTDAFGRLVIDVHVDPPGTTRDFRHWYCARFDATAVPHSEDPSRVTVTATVEGRQPCRIDETRDADMTHGRVPTDNEPAGIHDHPH